MWRCFPWDPGAGPGTPYSPSHLTRGQTVGRFDLHDRPPVRYFAESPEHAIGEALSAFRGTEFIPSYLRQGGHRLALVGVTLREELAAALPDCTDPAVLAAFGIRPDELAHHDRTRTQTIARRLHTAGVATGTPAGFRWWSALTGAWHATVIFADREGDGLEFGVPKVIDAGDPALLRALLVLGIRMR